MGFLANIFKSKEIQYLESFVAELKQDKTMLQQEVKELKENNNTLIESNIKLNNELMTIKSININTFNKDKPKLTPLEKKIYNSYNKHKPSTMNELSKLTGVKESSLRVYCSKMNKKLKEPISFRQY